MPRELYLSTYSGNCSDVMSLQPEIASGYMQAADMRRDIIIEQTPHDRVTGYDQIGDVATAHQIGLDRFHQNRNQTLFTRLDKDRDAWVIAIDDKALSEGVREQMKVDPRDYNTIFIEQFRGVVTTGLKKCLQEEKLFNGGNFSFALYHSYLIFLGIDIVAIPAITLDALGHVQSQPELLPLAIAGTAGAHGVIHMLNYLLAHADEFYTHVTGHRPQFNTGQKNDPLVRHTPLDFLMPAIPVDRIIRGRSYLKKNGAKLILNRSNKRK